MRKKRGRLIFSEAIPRLQLNGANGLLDIVIVSVHKRKMVTFGNIGSLPTKEEVIKQVNLRYDELFHYDDNGA